MYLLQLAQFFGHLVGALFALFLHRSVTSVSACAAWPCWFSASSSRSSRLLSISHPIAASRRTRSSPACSASAQPGENGLSIIEGLTILASGWLMLIATSSLRASCAVLSLCMLLLPSEHPPPLRPLYALLRLYRSGVERAPTLLLLHVLARFPERQPIAVLVEVASRSSTGF